MATPTRTYSERTSVGHIYKPNRALDSFHSIPSTLRSTPHPSSPILDALSFFLSPQQAFVDEFNESYAFKVGSDFETTASQGQSVILEETEGARRDLAVATKAKESRRSEMVEW